MRGATIQLGFVGVLVTASACVPFPHRERQTPFVQGTLSIKATPVSGVRVRVVAMEEGSTMPCSGAKYGETTSNAAGRFQFDPIMARRFTTALVMAHRFYEWEVCVNQNREWRRVFRNRNYTLVGVPGAGPMGVFVLKCESPVSQTAFVCPTSYDQDAAR